MPALQLYQVMISQHLRHRLRHRLRPRLQVRQRLQQVKKLLYYRCVKLSLPLCGGVVVWFQPRAAVHMVVLRALE